MTNFIVVLSIICLGLTYINCNGGLSDEVVNKVMEMSSYEELMSDVLDEASRTHKPQISRDNGVFKCTTNTKFTKAKSVHALRPSDIEIVASYGDSITAANGAKATNILGVLREDRGVSWSIGGESSLPNVITLPNILKKFTPNLKGFSTGSGKANSPLAGLNQAVAGSVSYDIMNQAKEIVRLINDMENSRNQWKIVTLFIGGNDLCKFCDDKDMYSADNYVKNIKESLDYLKANLPRAFVNVVTSLNVANVKDLTGKFLCAPIQMSLCKCAVRDEFSDDLNALSASYQTKTSDLIASGRYDTSDDFTVVLQPFLTKMRTPLLSTGKADFSYFAPDCFHFSLKGHTSMAVELWNSMLTPVGQKSLEAVFVDKDLKCPTTNSPYFFTAKN